MIIFGQKNLSYGINFNLGISHSDLSLIEIDPLIPGTSEGVSFGFGYQIGLNLQYDFSPSFLLRSGIAFRKNSSHHNLKGLIFPSDLSTRTTSSFMETLNTVYGSLPFEVAYKYNLPNKKMSFIVGTGIEWIFYNKDHRGGTILYGSIDPEPYNSNDLQKLDPNPISINIFLGIESKISNNLTLGIEPNISYNPKSYHLNLSSRIINNPFTAGISFRLRKLRSNNLTIVNNG